MTSIKYCDCVSAALITHDAMRIRLIVLPFVICLSLPYFTTLTRKLGYFGKKVTGKKICVFD